MSGKGLPWKPDLRLSSIGQNPCGLLAGNRDRDRRPCEGIPNASATRPVASAQTASRHSRGAVARWTGSSSTGLRVLHRVESKTHGRNSVLRIAQSVTGGWRGRQTAVLSFLADLAIAPRSASCSARPSPANR